MNRRDFLIKGVLAAVGLTALPAASALAQLPVALGTKEENIPACLATEAQAIDDILDVVKFWDDELPGHNFRELLLRRLVTEKTGIKDAWALHAMAVSGS